MANTSYIDQLVEFPAKALREIGTNKNIVALLTNNPNIDMESDEADSVFDKYLFDFVYIDSTTFNAEAYICVEAEMQKLSSPTMQDFKLYCTVICHKEFMVLNPGLFPGVIGNRRDNLVRCVDSVLNGSTIYGIGTLNLKSVKTMPSPVGFTSRELTYEVSDFKYKSISG